VLRLKKNQRRKEHWNETIADAGGREVHSSKSNLLSGQVGAGLLLRRQGAWRFNCTERKSPARDVRSGNWIDAEARTLDVDGNGRRSLSRLGGRVRVRQDRLLISRRQQQNAASCQWQATGQDTTACSVAFSLAR